MRVPRIKTLMLLGLAGAWALRQQSRQRARIAATQGSDHTLASLVDGDVPSSNHAQPVATAENPFPKGNPTPLPTGAGPGG